LLFSSPGAPAAEQERDAEGELALKRMTAQAQTMKETYESLISDINALQRRAPG